MFKTLPNNDYLTQRLQQSYVIAKEKHLIRKSMLVEFCRRERIKINGKRCINFSSNDYLGLSFACRKAFKHASTHYGFGSGSSVAISGYTAAQKILEENFAAFLNRDRAVFFNSGYLANLGVLPALTHPNDIILSDKLCHASILDGIRLTRAKHKRFLHNNLSHLESRLQNASGHSFILTESVFSMKGDISPLDKMASLAKQYHATLIVDDAHGFGILGKTGKGISEHFAFSQKDIPCLIVPLGKAMGGYGAIVAGQANIIEAIIQQARSYRYTTALPSAIIYGNIQTLNKLKKSNKQRNHLHQLSRYFTQEANSLNLPITSTHHTPINAILVKTNQKAQKIQSYLLEKGFYVSSIRPPTVPEGHACLRVSLNYYHTRKHIVRLLKNVRYAYDKL